MSITTMEELVAVPIGETITVNNGRGTQRWTRAVAGFTSVAAPETVLTPEYFAGAVASGAVWPGNQIEARPLHNLLTWRHVNRLQFATVVAVTGDNTGDVVITDGDGQFQRVELDTMLDVNEWTTENTYSFTPVVATMGVRMVAAIRDANTRADAPQVQVLRERLHGYAEAVGDDEFDELLDEVNLSRKEAVEVSVRVWGSQTLGDNAANLLFAPTSNEMSLAVENPDDVIDWVGYGTVTKQARPGVCACDDVDMDDIRALLPTAITAEFEYEASCPND